MTTDITITWACKKFEALAAEELYQILRLRNAVFVVEQNCVFQDCDNADQQCFHLAGYNKKDVVAYARLVPPGVIYAAPSIGRVLVNAAYRKVSTGKLLIQQAIEACKKLFGNTDIKIGAQLYLKKFYEGFGFVQSSDVYLEDNIEHIEMILSRA